MRTFIINYKAYREGIDRGIEIAMASRELADKLKIDIIVAVPFTLCRGAAKITRAISQGLDPIEPGAATGRVSWYEISKSGCVGALINHSENRMEMRDVEKVVSICKENSLLSYVCVESMVEARKVVGFGPTAISYENPSLIGGKKSVAEAEPGMVKEFVELIHNGCDSSALIGAGINSGADVKRCVDLGSDGILVASAVMKGGFKEKIDELGRELVG